MKLLPGCREPRPGLDLQLPLGIRTGQPGGLLDGHPRLLAGTLDEGAEHPGPDILEVKVLIGLWKRRKCHTYVLIAPNR